MTNHQTALITGGNGNLGRLVAARLRTRGIRVIKFDLAATEAAAADENEFFVAGDIRDSNLLQQLVREHRPDTIYHLASLLSGSSEINLADTWEINASASFNLLRLASEAGINRFFFASTAASYGPVEPGPMPLDYPQWPQNLYGATKVAVERLGVYFKTCHGLDFRCLRFPLVISPYAPASAISAFPSHAFRAAFTGERFSFPVAGNSGISTLFLDDVIDSIVDYSAADRVRLTQHVYNLHAYFLSAEMVAQAVRARFPEFDYVFEPVAAIEHLISSWPDCIDDSAARRDWGWNPAFDFDRSVERMCQLLAAEGNGSSPD